MSIAPIIDFEEWNRCIGNTGFSEAGKPGVAPGGADRKPYNPFAGKEEGDVGWLVNQNTGLRFADSGRLMDAVAKALAAPLPFLSVMDPGGIRFPQCIGNPAATAGGGEAARRSTGS